MTILQNIPTELVDAVVEDLDTSSLHTLSLASTTFREFTQKRLFRSVHLHQGPTMVGADGTTWGSFSRFLSTSVNAVRHVRSLTIRLPPDDSPEDEAALARAIDAISPHILDLALVGSSRRWASHSPGLRAAIGTILSAPRLQKLQLIDLRAVPADVLHPALATIHRLWLKDCTLRAPDVNPPESSLVSSVQELRLSSRAGSANGYDHLASHGAPRLGKLEHIYWDDKSENPMLNLRANNFFVAGASTLTSVHIDAFVLATPLVLPPLPSLTNLTLHISIFSPNHFPLGLGATLRLLPAGIIALVLRFDIGSTLYTRDRRAASLPILSRASASSEDVKVNLDAPVTRFEAHEYGIDDENAGQALEDWKAAVGLALPGYEPEVVVVRKKSRGFSFD
ncbi:hypothetical protein MKEN_01172700 [Mycena kentingensis (nom. inval.)]|nr:hypothetical protein MKEN_01172700 [Mycena kentingensis (nom. inval.)]